MKSIASTCKESKTKKEVAIVAEQVFVFKRYDILKRAMEYLEKMYRDQKSENLEIVIIVRPKKEDV